MKERDEVDVILDETYEQVKKEHAKLLKIFKGLKEDECFGENCFFKTVEDYNLGLSLLSNSMSYTLQLKQAKDVREATRNNKENNVIPFKPAEE